MKILSNIANAWSVLRKGMDPRLWLRGDEGSGSGAALTNAFQQSVWVYAAINALGTNVAQTPWRLSSGEASGQNIVEKGPLVDLFNRPHPQLDRFLFWELIVAWLMLRGEAFVYPDFGVNTLKRELQPGNLIVLCPDHFRELVSGHMLVGWHYTAGSGDKSPYPTATCLPEEVVHLKLSNPYNFWRGMAPLSVAMLAANTDYASAQFMKGLMLNNADTGVVVRTDQQLDPQQREQMLAALKERKRKAGTADRPLLLWGGAEVVKPTLSSTDMQFLENRKFNRQEICSVFGVPQEIVGFTEDANRSVSESARLNFIENRIAPLCERIESAFDPLVKRLDRNLYGWFDVDSLPIMQAARLARVDTGVKLFGIGAAFNDINRNLSLGFPDYDWGDQSFLPFGLMPAETAAEPPPEPKVEPGIETDPFSRAIRLLGSATGASLRAPGAGALPEVHQCAAPDEYQATLQARIRLKIGKLQLFFFQQRSRVLAQLDELLVGRAVTCAPNTLSPDGAQGTARPTQDRGLDDLFDLAGENSELVNRLRTVLIADLQFGGEKLFLEVGNPSDSFKLPPERAIEHLKKRTPNIKGINEVTLDKLKLELQQGLQEGDTSAQLADRVKEVYKEASGPRAETIATTETNIALNSGRMEGMQQAGVELKRWRTSNLANVRASHLAAEAGSAAGIPIDEPFANGLMFPGDPDGPADEVINCRCYMVAVIPKG